MFRIKKIFSIEAKCNKLFGKLNKNLIETWLLVFAEIFKFLCGFDIASQVKSSKYVRLTILLDVWASEQNVLIVVVV